jgi:cysteine desulfurase
MALVALHLANNETGVIQPIAEIGRIAREAGAVVVLDAVQAAGRIPLDISSGYADFMILSGHKIGGPKGVGALVAASDLLMPAPLISGGGQEKGHRGGTENVAAIAGFGAAARQVLLHLGEMDEVRRRRDAIEADILALAPDAVIYGRNAERLPNTSFFTLPGLKAETGQIAFDLAGVALSAGSACSSGRVGPSHVLEAMGHDGESGLRVSIGPATTARDVKLFRSALKGIVARRAARKEAA